MPTPFTFLHLTTQALCHLIHHKKKNDEDSTIRYFASERERSIILIVVQIYQSFPFWLVCVVPGLTKSFPIPRTLKCVPLLVYTSCVSLCFISRSTLKLELIFVFGVRQGLTFLFPFYLFSILVKIVVKLIPFFENSVLLISLHVTFIINQVSTYTSFSFWTPL